MVTIEAVCNDTNHPQRLIPLGNAETPHLKLWQFNNKTVNIQYPFKDNVQRNKNPLLQNSSSCNMYSQVQNLTFKHSARSHA